MVERQGRAPVWLTVVEFVITVLVLAFLTAGPEALDGISHRLRQHFKRLPTQQTVTRLAAPATEPRVLPASQVLGRAPSSSPQASTLAVRSGAPAPSPAPAVIQPLPSTHPTPRALVTPRARPTPRATPAAVRPDPRARVTPVAELTPAPTVTPPPPLSPRQYFDRLMREGHQLYHTGWYGPALARFKEANRVSPGSATVQLWVGRAAIKIGRLVEAREALERVAVLAPGSDAAREARVLLAILRERAAERSGD